MATQTATRAGTTLPVAGHGYAQNLKTAWGEISPTSPAAGDSIEMCRIPKGAVVVGGYAYGSRMDGGADATMASATLDMDIGVIGGDTDMFGNLGKWNHQAVAGVKPEVGYLYPFGGVLFASGGGFGLTTMTTGETVIGFTVVASAQTFVTGQLLGLRVDYYLP